MRLFTLLTLSAALAGCAAGSSGYYTQSVESWRGGKVSDLVNAWGKPYNTMSGPNGNTNYVYKRQSFSRTNNNYSPSIGVHPRNGGISVVTSTPNAQAPMNQSFGAYCLTVFTSTPKGKIVDTNIQGTNCYISQSAAERLANPKAS